MVLEWALKWKAWLVYKQCADKSPEVYPWKHLSSLS